MQGIGVWEMGEFDDLISLNARRTAFKNTEFPLVWQGRSHCFSALDTKCHLWTDKARHVETFCLQDLSIESVLESFVEVHCLLSSLDPGVLI